MLIFDPIGQGERLQYTDEQWKPRRGVGVSEHLHAGNQQFLVGEFFGAWRAWDGSGHSITCCPARKSIRGMSVSRAIPVAGR